MCVVGACYANFICYAKCYTYEMLPFPSPLLLFSFSSFFYISLFIIYSQFSCIHYIHYIHTIATVAFPSNVGRSLDRFIYQDKAGTSTGTRSDDRNNKKNVSSPKVAAGLVPSYCASSVTSTGSNKKRDRSRSKLARSL